MTILNASLINIIAHSEGFGINTDILETNVLNLAVVIGVLVYYGKPLISDIVTSRKNTILKTLEDAEARFQQASENLSFAKEQLQKAKIKAEQIRNQGTSIAKQAANKIINLAENDIKRLKETTLYTIKLEEEKCLTEVVRLLNDMAFVKAVEKIKQNLNSNVQKKIVLQNTEKLSNFKR
uniref:ATP synthase subunit b, chloroplastic n=1 Tax=Lepocinclis playfairiana TaxID=1403386 RepID=A0A3G3LLF0_9EUGL|nr:ATPase subunit I [Lepocinclis playfairiana]AYQ93544.1 ATPase subunit I [Lepocinclis playfairiana]